MRGIPATALVVAFTIGLVAGTFAGVSLAWHTLGATYARMSDRLAVETSYWLADFEYQHADESHARESLASFIRFAQELKVVRRVTNPKEIDFLTARAYIRLAALDKHAGNAESFQSDWSHFQEALSESGSNSAPLGQVDTIMKEREWPDAVR